MGSVRNHNDDEQPPKPTLLGGRTGLVTDTLASPVPGIFSFFFTNSFVRHTNTEDDKQGTRDADESRVPGVFCLFDFGHNHHNAATTTT
jgi:hypothetical protein